MEPKTDVKELMEGLAALKEVATTGKKAWALFEKIKENGIGLDDLIYIKELPDLAPDMDVINAGIKDIDKAMEEIKDLDQEEAVKIVIELFAIIKALREA